jgi:membrane dipeptidase
MFRHPRLSSASTSLLLLAAFTACAQNPAPDASATPRTATMNDDAFMARARAVDDRVLTIDTHVDIDPENFEVGTLNYGQRLNTQVDLTKMEQGGLDAIFFSIYVGQGPLDSAGYARAWAVDTAKLNAIHRLAEVIAPDRIAIAYRADDVRRISASGKKVALMGVENGYGIGTDLSRVKELYDRGGRYLSLAHNGNNQLSDSNTGEANNDWLWGNGISPLGKQVIAEMNRLGMMVDISHPSKGSIMQALALSKAPVIASHSGVRAICNNARNLDDEELKALAENRGVVPMVAYRGFVKCDPEYDAARAKAMAALNSEYGIAVGRRTAGGGGAARRGPTAGVAGNSCGPARVVQRGGISANVQEQLAAMPTSRADEYRTKLRALEERYPARADATVKDFVNHIDYAVKLIGLDHVGISSDFDGGGGLADYNCALESVNITAELLRRGYTEEQIGKIWSGNLLRVMGEVEQVAKRLRGGAAL